MKKHLFLLIALVVTLLALPTGPASATVIHSTFSATLDTGGAITGVGWAPYEWVDGQDYYVQWFFNDSEILDHYKEIEYYILFQTTSSEAYAIAAINWTTALYSDPQTPPTQNDFNTTYVTLTQLYNDYPDPSVQGVGVWGELTIPDFNPVWVSIDIWGHDVTITGWIDHECLGGDNPVPIPGAVWLLGSGLLGLAGFRKKFIG